MTLHIWNNHKIEVKSKAIAKHLWCTINFTVKIDDEKIFESPNHLEGITSSIPFTIKNDGEEINGVVKSLFPTFAIYARYKVCINNVEINRGKVIADNWYFIYGLFGLLFLSIVFIL